MHYVYLIRSISNPDQTYIGLTDDLKSRLNKHNEGGSPHTSKYKPWELVTYLAFSAREQAAEFEAYLKSLPKIREWNRECTLMNINNEAVMKTARILWKVTFAFDAGGADKPCNYCSFTSIHVH
ncbi:GIY-YIG nuclease family protein [Pontiellaceae bacterium B1224]|nr:GIY-YIG nuclease family protein [Pontiellaceae bacterium B1224]